MSNITDRDHRDNVTKKIALAQNPETKAWYGEIFVSSGTTRRTAEYKTKLEAAHGANELALLYHGPNVVQFLDVKGI
jgi:hypothetical protein